MTASAWMATVTLLLLATSCPIRVGTPERKVTPPTPALSPYCLWDPESQEDAAKPTCDCWYQAEVTETGARYEFRKCPPRKPPAKPTTATPKPKPPAPKCEKEPVPDTAGYALICHMTMQGPRTKYLPVSWARVHLESDKYDCAGPCAVPEAGPPQ